MIDREQIVLEVVVPEAIKIVQTPDLNAGHVTDGLRAAAANLLTKVFKESAEEYRLKIEERRKPR